MSRFTSKKGQLDEYFNVGRTCRERYQIPQAIKNFEQALKLSKELKDGKEFETMANLELGCSYEMNNQIPMATEYYEKALEIARNQGYKQWESHAYLRLGAAYTLKNQIQKAIEHYEKGLEFVKERGYKKEAANAYLGLGDAYRFNNQIQKAMEYYEKALQIAIEQGYKKEAANAYLGVGDAYRLNNQIQKAIEYYEKGLEIAKEQGYKKEETNVYLWLGNAYKLINQMEKAIEYYLKVLEIAKKQGYKEKETRTYRRLGEAYTLNKQFQKGMEYYNKAWEIENKRAYQNLTKNATEELPKFEGSPESSKWEVKSKVHKEKFVKLLQLEKDHPEEVKCVNGVRVCCSMEFLIGMGSHGTRVYVGLGTDGYERAVKRLPRDACTDEADQEKKVLNELNATKSKYVVNYWFLDEQSDKDYLFLTLDLCEETLETFVADKSWKDLVTIAPVIIGQILNGLADLHCDPKPVLHRDLKPSNILRDVDGNWLLADFGISRIITAGATSHASEQRGADDWRAVESSYNSNYMPGDSKVRYKKESDIQVAGMVAFYIVTKGQHPFGEKEFRLHNLLIGKPVGVDMLKDPALKDLLSWMLSHDPKNRPSAEEALKHPYLQPAKQQFEMLCKMGNQPEIKTGDGKSDVVRKLNSNPKDWRSLVRADILQYLSTDPLKRKRLRYRPSWTDCLRLIRNVDHHWSDRPSPRPKVFYVVGDPQEYFLTLFPHLPVNVHRIVRSCDWKERRELKEYFV